MVAKHAGAAAGSPLDVLAKVEEQPMAFEGLWPSHAAASRYVAESARRPVYQARQVLRDGASAAASADAAAAPVASLAIDSSESRSPLYLDTAEQRLVAAGPARTTTIRRPTDPLLPARVAACVQLSDRAAAGWQRDEERSKVWIEYLSTSDLGQGVASPSPRRVGGRAPSALGGPWFGESLSMAFVALVRLARAFHTRGVRVARRTHDKFHADASTIELGYSVFPGGAQLQMHARRHGIAYERRATALAHRDALGPLVERAAPVAWDFLARRYPGIAREMLREVGRYGIYGTGFSKVTVAYDNPTCVHYDSNFGADVVMAFRLRSLKGGEHVMLSVDGCEAVVVETSELGVLIGGCHAHLLHGNLGTTDGGRVVLAWYMPDDLRKHAPNRFDCDVETRDVI